jgi:hypothetical protein
MKLNKIQIVKYLFIANAVFVSVGYAALSGLVAFAYDSGPGPHLKGAIITFSIVFFTLSIFWSLFCYGAYKGIKSNKLYFKIIFWLFVMCSIVIVVFPVGIMFVVALFSLLRSIKKDEATSA